MAFGIGKNKVSPIAIDFGSDSIKVLQLADGDPPQLIAAAGAPLPEDARRDQPSRYEFLAESLKSLLKSAPFRGRRAVCSIPAFQTLAQNLPIPPSGSSLDDAIAQQLRERLLVEPTRMVLRSNDVGDIERNGKTHREVVCLAAERGIVNRYLQVLHACKLEVCGMQTEQVALLAAYSAVVGGVKANATTLLIDIGAASTKIVAAHGDKLVLARTAAVGGDQFVRELAKKNQLDFAEGRALFMAQAGERDATTRATVFGGSDDPGDAALATATLPGGGDAGDPADAGSEAVACITDEVRLAVRYHRSLFPRRSIDQLVFFGGGARHASICRAIAQRVRLAGRTGNPTGRIQSLARNRPFGVSFDEPQPGWAVPVGLCLTETDL